MSASISAPSIRKSAAQRKTARRQTAGGGMRTAATAQTATTAGMAAAQTGASATAMNRALEQYRAARARYRQAKATLKAAERQVTPVDAFGNRKPRLRGWQRRGRKPQGRSASWIQGGWRHAQSQSQYTQSVQYPASRVNSENFNKQSQLIAGRIKNQDTATPTARPASVPHSHPKLFFGSIWLIG